jgi:hypothetical protein
MNERLGSQVGGGALPHPERTSHLVPPPPWKRPICSHVLIGVCDEILAGWSRAPTCDLSLQRFVLHRPPFRRLRRILRL